MKKAETVAQTATATNKKGFTDDEKSAMKNRAKELKAEEKASKNRGQGESDLRAAIAEMEEPERSMAQKIYEIITATAPDLAPKTWYGQPAWANKDGSIICFFQPKQKFNIRYSTFGFNEKAKLDDGDMWPVAFAIDKLTPAAETKIKALVKKSVG